jgi:hypothetical protein
MKRSIVACLETYYLVVLKKITSPGYILVARRDREHGSGQIDLFRRMKITASFGEDTLVADFNTDGITVVRSIDRSIALFGRMKITASFGEDTLVADFNTDGITVVRSIDRSIARFRRMKITASFGEDTLVADLFDTGTTLLYK